MIKVKIITSIHSTTLEDAINVFNKDRVVRDIKYQTAYDA